MDFSSNISCALPTSIAKQLYNPYFAYGMISPMHNEKRATQARIIDSSRGVLMPSVTFWIRMNGQPPKIRAEKISLLLGKAYEKLEGDDFST